MRRGLALLCLLLPLALPACGGGSADPESTEPSNTEGITPETGEDAGSGSQNFNVSLNELNGSGQQGSAVVTAEEGELTRVSIQLDGNATEPQPAHIHEGTCADLNPEPKYPLENVENGRSETLVEARFEDIRGGSFSINVHKSEAESDTYVACGELPGGSPGG